MLEATPPPSIITEEPEPVGEVRRPRDETEDNSEEIRRELVHRQLELLVFMGEDSIGCDIQSKKRFHGQLTYQA